MKKQVNIPFPQSLARKLFSLAFADVDTLHVSLVGWLCDYWHLVDPEDRDFILRRIATGNGNSYWLTLEQRAAEQRPVDFVLSDKDKTLPAKALYLAVTAHDGAGQLYAGQPYSKHILEVYEEALAHLYLLPAHKHEPALGGAALHDAIEDGYFTKNDLIQEVGEPIARIAQLLDSSTGATRKERHDDAYYQRLATSETATFVKLCDRLANVRAGKGTKKSADMRERYTQEQAHVESQLQVETRFPRLLPLLNELRRELGLPTT